MAEASRKSREAELLIKIQTEPGRADLLKELKFQLGLQSGQMLPAGMSLVQELLDTEFGPIQTPM